jgi:hypothetical protein
MEYPEEHVSTFIWIGVGFLLFILLISIIVAIFRYVSETALIRMVDEYEQTGEKVGFKQGWRLGWSRASWRLFLINLIVNLPVILLVPTMLLLLLAPILMGINTGFATFMPVFGIIVGVGLIFLLVIFLIVVMTFLNLLRQFVWRVCALENVGVGEAFRKGFGLFKRNWQSILLMWLVMFGIGIGYTFAGFLLFFLLIPVYALTTIFGLIVAAVPGLIAFGIANLFTITPLAAIIGAVVGIPFLVMVIFSPLIFVGGLASVFRSSVWTLTYREITLMENGRDSEAEAQ